jgi:hypothetical protein
MPAARPRDTILVQAGGDGFGAFSGRKFAENAPDYLSLPWVDLAQAAFRLPVAAHDPTDDLETIANAAA